MRAKTFFVLLAISVLPCTSAGLAAEAADGSVEALREEIAELEKVVAELTKQVTALQRQIDRLRGTVRGQPPQRDQWFRRTVRDLVLEADLRPEGDLLFPIEVERAMMIDVLQGPFRQTREWLQPLVPQTEWIPDKSTLRPLGKDPELPTPSIERTPDEGSFRPIDENIPPPEPPPIRDDPFS